MFRIRSKGAAFSVLLLTTATLSAGDDQTPKIREFDENRVTVDASTYPFSAIGRLNGAGIDRRSHCTATLISPNHILTAAHCLYFRARKRWFLPSEINFLAGYQRGNFAAHGRIADISAKGSFDPEAPASQASRSGDWAILTLEGTLDIEPLRVRAWPHADASRTFQQAGYHRRRPHVQTLNPACSVVERQEKTFMHDCMLAPGDSGSPILYEEGGTFYVVGVNTLVIRRGPASKPTGFAISSDVFSGLLDGDEKN